MDERNPHMHLCFVPLTQDNRLSAKEIMGNRNKLIEWQDKFHDHMAQEFPQLDRGQAAAVTKRKHVPTWLYKQSPRLTSEMVQIQKEIKNIGTLNAGRQREKILTLLMNWYPQVNAFEVQLRPYDEQLKIMEQNEQILRRNEEQAQWLRQQERQENESLLYELRKCQDFIDSIPEDLFEELKRHYELSQEQELGL